MNHAAMVPENDFPELSIVYARVVQKMFRKCGLEVNYRKSTNSNITGITHTAPKDQDGKHNKQK
jgi:hypothetical protein